jgi:cystathionine beta-lyase/cystathionine gamma-synthase
MLIAHPRVARVHYPGLPSHPQHELARRQMQDFGAVVTLDLQGGAQAAARFTDALRLFAITPSLGSTESLVMPSQMLTGHDLNSGQMQLSGITEGTVRLSIGLEDIDDLLADVEQALAVATGSDATVPSSNGMEPGSDVRRPQSGGAQVRS